MIPKKKPWVMMKSRGLSMVTDDKIGMETRRARTVALG